MSAAQPTAPTPATAPEQRQITIVSHSNLFYWWPVWAMGFLLGMLTLVSERMVTVPTGSKAAWHADVKVQEEGKEVTYQDREVVILPKDHKIPRDNPQEAPHDPRLHMSPNKNFGKIFAIVFLIVLFITNVPLRGMWSVMVIGMAIMLVIILWLAELLPGLAHMLGLLDIRINAGGYFFISSVLLVLWLVIFVFFDKQIYMIFEPGQLRVCTEIGGGETRYDATGMILQKQRSDLFRHWILGLGSGDLVVNTTGAQAHHFDMPNVLFIGKKVRQVEDMLKKRAVVETR